MATDAWTAGVFADWRSRARAQGTVWLARAGVDAAGEGTPFALWAGAGTGQGREARCCAPTRCCTTA